MKTEYTELTLTEMTTINGGKPICYYLGEAAGFVVGTFVSLLAGFKDGITGAEKR